MSQVRKLCQILVESNLQLCESIKEEGVNVQNLYDYFKWTARKINKLSKMIEENDEIHDNKPRCKDEEGAQNNDEEYDKLIDRTEKLKQSRNIDKKNGTRLMMKMMN